MKRTYKFNAGEQYSLDCIYDVQALIPHEAYEQDDISDWSPTNGNDCGETVRFLKNVTVKVDVIVT